MHTETNKPLYKIVVDETLHQLSSGVIKVGHRFPPEADYADDLGVSRYTVREAFSRLENAGVIDSLIDPTRCMLTTDVILVDKI